MKIRPLADIEREHILHSLYQARGHITITARKLGISIRTLRLKIIQYRREGVWVVPCQCQWGRRITRCQNHDVDLTTYPDEMD